MSLLCSGVSVGCVVTITDCEFENNSARGQGGSIYWKDSMPEINNCSYIGGRAMYGPDIASFPIRLNLSSIITSETEAGKTSGELLGIASGQLTDQVLIVTVLDHYGQVVTIDTGSALSLASANSSTSVLGVTAFSAVNGTYLVQGFGITAPPASATTLLLRSTAVDYTKKAKSRDNLTYSDSLAVSVQMRTCLLGESHQSDQCLICPASKYSLDPEGSCKACPEGAICYGNYTMVPQEEYWRVDMLSEQFWLCPYKPACLGSPEPPNVLSFTGLCAEGYFGNLCNGCSPGFSRLNAAECARCPSFLLNTVRTIGIILAVLTFLALIVWSTIRSAERTRSHLSIYIKIFLNYLQLVMITAGFSLSWPAYVGVLLDAQQSAGNAADQIFSIDCFVGTSSEEDQATALRLKLVFMAFLPPLILALGLVVWLPVALVRRKGSFVKNEMVATCVVCFFLVHPSLVRFQFAFLNCKELSAGSYWLAAYLNIKCWDSIHLRYVLIVAVPSMILWTLGLPALCLMYIYKSRYRLALTYMKLRLGFIYNGYTPEKFYWEFIIIYRKILIISIAVFFTSVSTYLQALTVMIVILAALSLQSKHKPYIVPDMNELEVRGILVGGVTIYCGLFSLTQGLDLPAQVVLLVILVLANAYFLSYWVFKVVSTSWHILKLRCKWLNSLFSGRYKVQSASPSVVPMFGTAEHLRNSSIQLNCFIEDAENSRIHLKPPDNSRID